MSKWWAQKMHVWFPASVLAARQLRCLQGLQHKTPLPNKQAFHMSSHLMMPCECKVIEAHTRSQSREELTCDIASWGLHITNCCLHCKRGTQLVMDVSAPKSPVQSALHPPAGMHAACSVQKTGRAPYTGTLPLPHAKCEHNLL